LSFVIAWIILPFLYRQPASTYLSLLRRRHAPCETPHGGTTIITDGVAQLMARSMPNPVIEDSVVHVTR
jgi:hypothetical protein